MSTLTTITCWLMMPESGILGEQASFVFNVGQTWTPGFSCDRSWPPMTSISSSSSSRTGRDNGLTAATASDDLWPLPRHDYHPSYCWTSGHFLGVFNTSNLLRILRHIVDSVVWLSGHWWCSAASVQHWLCKTTTEKDAALFHSVLVLLNHLFLGICFMQRDTTLHTINSTDCIWTRMKNTSTCLQRAERLGGTPPPGVIE